MTAATSGVADIAEGVHLSVLRTMGLVERGERETVGGITGLAYRTVHGITRLTGSALDLVLASAEQALPTGDLAHPGSPRRQAIVAALNGVLGDYLVSSSSPLAIPMSFHCRGHAIGEPGAATAAGATNKVLLLVHGLCRHDGQWASERKGVVVDHGEALASALGYTPVRVRYNTGLHVSQNGAELSARLEALLAAWPVRIAHLAVVAHSMGGLVMRSACHEAAVNGRRWLQRLRHVAFLGTPHHGAPLERAGHGFELLLEGTAFTAPFGALGRLRSAGITDLRYGHLLASDWEGRDRFRRAPDTRAIVPLPEGVNCYAMAATTAAKRRPLVERLIGDGLVPVPSALGQHADPARSLAIPHASQAIVYRTTHLQLLNSPEVTRQLIAWFSAPARGRTRRSPRRPAKTVRDCFAAGEKTIPD